MLEASWQHFAVFGQHVSERTLLASLASLPCSFSTRPFFRDNVPLRGGTAVGHCRKALRRDIAVVQCFGVCNVILQSSAAVGTAMGHCSEALQRGTAVEHCWVAAVGHCNGALQ